MNGRFLSVLVVVIVLLALAGRVVTNEITTPGFCRRCHLIEPFYMSWQIGQHAQRSVVCVDCHFESGWMGQLRGEAYAAIKLGQFMVGAVREPTAARFVVNENCLRCHQDILQTQIKLPGELAFSHEQHVDQNQAKCAQCHPAIGHPGAVTQAIVGQPARYNRDLCLRCHDGRRGPTIFGAITRSGKLHPGEPMIDTGLWKQTHWRAKSGLTTDAGPNFKFESAECIRCHGVPRENQECQGCHTPIAQTLPGSTQPCLKCHLQIMTTKLLVEGLPYSHQTHLLATTATCHDCHQRITHDQICSDCHNGVRAPDIFSVSTAK